MREAELKVWFRKNWAGWVESYEPRLGSNVGIPDLQVVVDQRLVPIELKLCQIVGDELLSSDIRPPQINWHRTLSGYGVPSLFLFGSGVGKSPDCLFAAPGYLIDRWEFGFKITDLSKINHDKDLFSKSLTDYIKSRF